MKVTEILRDKGTNVLTTWPGATVRAAMERMASAGVGSLAVVDSDGSLLGLVSERDIIRAMARNGPTALADAVRDVMAKPAVTCSPDAHLADLMATMTNRRVRHLVVVDELGRLAGIVSIGDLVKARLRELEFESQVLRDAYLRVR